MGQVNFKVDTQKLDKLRAAMGKRILKKAMRAGLRPVVAGMRSRVPVRSGALKKSISTKVDSKKDGLRVYGVVGPRSKFQKIVKGRVKKPSKYSHFINKIHHYLESMGSLIPGTNKIMQDVIARETQAVLSK